MAQRRLKDYPIGTKALAICGGYWIKTHKGWKWCTGSTFSRPGADAYKFIEPKEQ